MRLKKTIGHFFQHPLLFFLYAWLVTTVLYFPARRAGFVGDYFKDWLVVIQESTFLDFIHRPGTSTLYQFTQLVTYGIYSLIGSSRTGWHQVHILLHAVTALLLFVFIKRLLFHFQVYFPRSIAFAIGTLFLVSPYNAEVVVHEPCLHYTIGFCLLLLPILLVQHYLSTGKQSFLPAAALCYLPACFSLEVFYLTPLLVVSLWFAYRRFTGYRPRFVPILLYCLLPMAVFLVLHFALVRAITASILPHQVIYAPSQLLADYGSKILNYLFHLVALGRFMPLTDRTEVYRILSGIGPVLFFHAAVAIFMLFVYAGKINQQRLRLVAFLLPVALLFLAIVTPRQFPDLGLVVFDRYLYFALPIVYLIVALIITTRKSVYLALLVFLAFLTINVWWLCGVNKRWKESNKLVEHLIRSFPIDNGKTTLLLNLPENYDGILMIGSSRPSALKTAYNAKQNRKILGNVYDIASYNMNTMSDGAHVRVLNDSTLRVTLNQWGTWWWFHFIGASGFENEWYRLDMRDPGHWYELVLKKPAYRYQLLYINERNWRYVDMQKKDIEQY